MLFSINPSSFILKNTNLFNYSFKNSKNKFKTHKLSYSATSYLSFFLSILYICLIVLVIVNAYVLLFPSHSYFKNNTLNNSASAYNSLYTVQSHDVKFSNKILLENKPEVIVFYEKSTELNIEAYQINSSLSSLGFNKKTFDFVYKECTDFHLKDFYGIEFVINYNYKYLCIDINPNFNNDNIREISTEQSNNDSRSIINKYTLSYFNMIIGAKDFTSEIDNGNFNDNIRLNSLNAIDAKLNINISIKYQTYNKQDNKLKLKITTFPINDQGHIEFVFSMNKYNIYTNSVNLGRLDDHNHENKDNNDFNNTLKDIDLKNNNYNTSINNNIDNYKDKLHKKKSNIGFNIESINYKQGKSPIDVYFVFNSFNEIYINNINNKIPSFLTNKILIVIYLLSFVFYSLGYIIYRYNLKLYILENCLTETEEINIASKLKLSYIYKGYEDEIELNDKPKDDTEELNNTNLNLVLNNQYLDVHLNEIFTFTNYLIISTYVLNFLINKDIRKKFKFIDKFICNKLALTNIILTNNNCKPILDHKEKTKYKINETIYDKDYLKNKSEQSIFNYFDFLSQGKSLMYSYSINYDKYNDNIKNNYNSFFRYISFKKVYSCIYTYIFDLIYLIILSLIIYINVYDIVDTNNNYYLLYKSNSLLHRNEDSIMKINSINNNSTTKGLNDNIDTNINNNNNNNINPDTINFRLYIEEEIAINLALNVEINGQYFYKGINNNNIDIIYNIHECTSSENNYFDSIKEEEIYHAENINASLFSQYFLYENYTDFYFNFDRTNSTFYNTAKKYCFTLKRRNVLDNDIKFNFFSCKSSYHTLYNKKIASSSIDNTTTNDVINFDVLSSSESKRDNCFYDPLFNLNKLVKKEITKRFYIGLEYDIYSLNKNYNINNVNENNEHIFNVRKFKYSYISIIPKVEEPEYFSNLLKKETYQYNFENNFYILMQDKKVIDSKLSINTDQTKGLENMFSEYNIDLYTLSNNAKPLFTINVIYNDNEVVIERFYVRAVDSIFYVIILAVTAKIIINYFHNIVVNYFLLSKLNSFNNVDIESDVLRINYTNYSNISDNDCINDLYDENNNEKYFKKQEMVNNSSGMELNKHNNSSFIKLNNYVKKNKDSIEFKDLNNNNNSKKDSSNSNKIDSVIKENKTIKKKKMSHRRSTKLKSKFMKSSLKIDNNNNNNNNINDENSTEQEGSSFDEEEIKRNRNFFIKYLFNILICKYYNSTNNKNVLTLNNLLCHENQISDNKSELNIIDYRNKSLVSNFNFISNFDISNNSFLLSNNIFTFKNDFRYKNRIGGILSIIVIILSGLLTTIIGLDLFNNNLHYQHYNINISKRELIDHYLNINYVKNNLNNKNLIRYTDNNDIINKVLDYTADLSTASNNKNTTDINNQEIIDNYLYNLEDFNYNNKDINNYIYNDKSVYNSNNFINKETDNIIPNTNNINKIKESKKKDNFKNYFSLNAPFMIEISKNITKNIDIHLTYPYFKYNVDDTYYDFKSNSFNKKKDLYNKNLETFLDYEDFTINKCTFEEINYFSNGYKEVKDNDYDNINLCDDVYSINSKRNSLFIPNGYFYPREDNPSYDSKYIYETKYLDSNSQTLKMEFGYLKNKVDDNKLIKADFKLFSCNWLDYMYYKYYSDNSDKMINYKSKCSDKTVFNYKRKEYHIYLYIINYNFKFDDINKNNRKSLINENNSYPYKYKEYLKINLSEYPYETINIEINPKLVLYINNNSIIPFIGGKVMDTLLESSSEFYNNFMFYKFHLELGTSIGKISSIYYTPNILSKSFNFESSNYNNNMFKAYVYSYTGTEIIIAIFIGIFLILSFIARYINSYYEEYLITKHLINNCYAVFDFKDLYRMEKKEDYFDNNNNNNNDESKDIGNNCNIIFANNNGSNNKLNSPVKLNNNKNNDKELLYNKNLDKVNLPTSPEKRLKESPIKRKSIDDDAENNKNNNVQTIKGIN